MSAPSLSKQLRVFHDLMQLGDIVSRASEAWIRVADVEGPASDLALKMAGLCQQALDARKLALTINRDEVKAIDDVLRKFQTPSWRGGSSKRTSNSSKLQSSFCELL